MAEFVNQNRELMAAIVGGIIATLGSVAAIVTSHYLKQTGKIIVNLNSSELLLFKPDKGGGQVRASSASEAESLTVLLGIDMYNSSDVPKSIRELSIEFKPISGNKPLLLPPFTNIGGGDSQIKMFPYSKIQVVNLPPKEIVHIDLRCWAKKEELAGIVGTVVVSFTAVDPNGKKSKFHLLTTDMK